MEYEELEREYKKLKQEIEEKDKKSGVNFLITKGLPELGRNTVTICKPSTNKSINNNKNNIQIIESCFNILGEYDIESLLKMKNTSLIWFNAYRHNGKTAEWNSESVIEKFVYDVLDDTRMYLKEKDDIKLFLQQDLSSIEKKYRPDITAIRTKNNDIIGICEIKKPSIGGNDLDNMELYNQINNYMQELRYTYGVKYVFGIITTYNEWKICWYSNSTTIAKAVSIEETNQYIENDKDSYPYDINENELYTSKCYKYNDPVIIQILISCVNKMFLTKSETPVKIYSNNYRFRYIESNQNRLCWKFLSPNIKHFTYKFPHSSTKNFYLLRKYHRGRDGLVWLVCSNNGNLAVIKISNVLDKTEAEKSLEEERNNWRTLWNYETFVTNFLDEKMLVMPYAFHYVKNDKSKIYFKSLNIWNDVTEDRYIDILGQEDILEIQNKCFNSKEFKDYINNPMKVAREALTEMKNKGFIHMDIKWNHVALLPVKVNDDNWTVKPIMIDLTDIKKMDSNNINIEEQLKNLDN
ncbi:hypothetical protein HDU92_008475 [Lobulomyces angularis]|nr:hypothetical protein HDU92_008475 [Lobulomyces angularis]